MEWIDVNERLPDKDGKYIVCVKNIAGYHQLESDVFIADYFIDEFLYEGWQFNRITHWMPLPEPPKNDFKE